MKRRVPIESYRTNSKRHKYHLGKFPDELYHLIPELKTYNDLVRFEQKMDAFLMKYLVRNSLPMPPDHKIIRVYIKHEILPSNGMHPKKWQLEFCCTSSSSKSTKSELVSFSTYFDSIQIQFDQKAYPSEIACEWKSTSDSKCHKIRFEREFHQNTQCVILLKNCRGLRRYKVDALSAAHLGCSRSEVFPRLLSCLWHYIKAKELIDEKNPLKVNCDRVLSGLLKLEEEEQSVKLYEIETKLKKALEEADPIRLPYEIKEDEIEKCYKCFDLFVKEEQSYDEYFEQRKKKVEMQIGKETDEMKEKKKEIEEIQKLIEKHWYSYEFFNAFSSSPIDVIHSILEGQKRDIQLLAEYQQGNQWDLTISALDVVSSRYQDQDEDEEEEPDNEQHEGEEIED